MALSKQRSEMVAAMMLHIQELEEENEKLKGTIETLKETNMLLIKQKGQLQEDLDMLDRRIDKSIEYIYYNSTLKKVFADIFDEYKNSEPKFYGNIKDLLKMLKGE